MKVRIKFRKYGVMKFIGHLDVMRFFQKALRRAGIPVKMTGGFSPHMVMSFASPLGVGLTSDGEYFDVELTQPVRTAEGISRLNCQMVEGMEVTGFIEIPDDKKNKGMTLVAGASWLSTPQTAFLPSDWEEQLAAFYRQQEILVTKETKKSSRKINIRPLIHALSVRNGSIFMVVSAGSTDNLKPELVTEAFLKYLGIFSTDESFPFLHHRVETYANCQAISQIPDTGRTIPVQFGQFVALGDLGREIV